MQPAPPAPFQQFGPADVRDLVAAYPLAWVVGGGAQPGGPAASLLPLLGQYGADGRLEALVGHLGRRNPLAAAMAVDPRVTILFHGPSGYVSPEHAGRRNWGPTWNYAQLAVSAEVTLDAALTGPAIALLVETMEAGRAEPWTEAELGPRAAGMREAIIGFEARVTGLSGTFKLGQDEDAETFAHIVASHPDAALTAWMQRMTAAQG